MKIMRATPISLADKELINQLQRRLDELRQRMNVSSPGEVLYLGIATDGDDRVLYVEADGLGGAVLRLVEGNYPIDYYTHEEKLFATEDDALEAAEAFWDKRVSV